MQLCRTYEAQVAPAISRASPAGQRPASDGRYLASTIARRGIGGSDTRRFQLQEMRSIADEFVSGDKAGTRCLAGFEQRPPPSGSGWT